MTLLVERIPPQAQRARAKPTLTLRALTHADRAAWEALVARTPESGFGQTFAWAEFKQREGYTVWPLGVFDGSTLIAGTLIHAYEGGDRTHTVLFSPEGPVLPWAETERARAALRLLLNEAKAVAAQTGALSWRIEPHLLDPRPNILKEFGRAPMDVYPSQTMVLDLTQPETALSSAMHPKGRYNVRLAAKHGVGVESVPGLEGLDRFYRLFDQTATRDQFYSEPKGYFINLLDALTEQGMARLYFAQHEGQDLASALVITFGGRWVYLYGASTRERREVMAPYALQWKIIQDAQRAGASEYDLYGYEPHGLADHLYAGFSKFKRQFAGQTRRYIGAQDFVFYDQLADAYGQALLRSEPTQKEPDDER